MIMLRKGVFSNKDISYLINDAKKIVWSKSTLKEGHAQYKHLFNYEELRKVKLFVQYDLRKRSLIG